MFNVEKNEYIYTYEYYRNKYYLKIFKSEQELIQFLAEDYRIFEEQIFNTRFEYKYYDNYGREICPYNYKEEAWEYYNKYLKGKVKQYNWFKNKKYKGTFRETPVEGISKWRGGPPVRPRRIKQLKAMYSNPEYKEFNRGSADDLPQGWWDDWNRSIERNWKSQSKRKHQWKGDNSM